jgi:hypothetical protein
VSFTQIIELEGVTDEQALRDHIARWHREQSGEAPGYQHARVLADRDGNGRYLVEVEFSSVDEAERNNGREATERWATGLRDLATQQPGYRNLEARYATGD